MMKQIAQIKCEIENLGGVPVSIQVWEDLPCYFNTLIEQRDELKKVNRRS